MIVYPTKWTWRLAKRNLVRNYGRGDKQGIRVGNIAKIVVRGFFL